MFFLLLLVFIGVSYTWWKYFSSANRKLFFSSPFFYSAAGSFLILFISFTLVNTLVPDHVGYDHAAVDDAVLEADTSFSALHDQHDLSAHYKLILLITSEHPGYLPTIRRHYRSLSFDVNAGIASLGYFGTGVLNMEAKEYDLALKNLLKIPDQNLPYIHYCLAKSYENTKQKFRAEENYWAELSVKNGNHGGAFRALMKIYESDQDYAKLKKLLDQFPEDEFMDYSLARLTLLHEKDYAGYFIRTFKTIIISVKPWGLVAAVLIAVAWILYLFQLSIFRKSNAANLVLMFAGGSLFVLLVFGINDFIELYTQWSLDGSFLNDLFFATFKIGVPEEIAKIIPLLILIAFSKPFKEPIEYIIYASASALGFSFIENLLYFQDVSSGVIHGRAYLSVIGHMVDSSIVAYAFVLHHFKKKRSLWLLLCGTLLAGSIFHGLYDFLIFQNALIFFFIFFVFAVQVWIIIINNCLNNSTRFSYKNVYHAERIQVYITLALTSVFAVEYLLSGITNGSERANQEFYINISFAGFSIIFFTSNLSSFNLVKGYWRDIYFSSREKRGYGTLAPRTLLTSWYFVNAIKAHNYVGRLIVLYNDLNNRLLAEVMYQEYEGKIVDRIILYDGDDTDPHWFLIELVNPVFLESASGHYVLIKLRNQEESLIDDGYVQVFFKAVEDLSLLKSANPQKREFPSYGWARVRCPMVDQHNDDSGDGRQ